ncbi:AI-2E family transporter [Pseudalkalibacillus hwajinpoensis]|uniref:AI-2E family transporter n=1 Tax=Guptibacillus hwajinpoensis TaxID=208199 RepID=A0A4U1MDR7_9BACL|nr:AI-2E family transporter [Pseudalkalibacillus hwajinpoensis]TKD68276.1 AI-2E family transporter [Pseudalkalibacillus hwajinpoensis]
MWIKHDFFKYITGIILVLICFFFLTELNLLKPVKTIIGTLFYPVLIAGFLYYAIKPIVRFVKRLPYVTDIVAIILVFASITGLLYGAFTFLANPIQKQVSEISKQLPEKLKKSADEAEKAIEKNDMGMLSMENIRQKATGYLGDLTQNLGDHITQVVGALTSATTVLIIVPFVLFYFLKDDHKLRPFLLNFIPTNHKDEGKKILHNINQTLSAYIIGQIIVAIVDGSLMYIGYLIIGLPYALILALFVTVTAVVPFFGPIIGVIPALVVALTQDPIMAFYVLIIMVVVQQLEGNLVAPVVLGSRLNIHPLTIILLLIVAAALYGFIGMLIAIPLYSVVKVTIKNLYNFYKLRHSQV